MCEKCNESLLAATQAALSLSQAAANLYSINQHAEAVTLAKAAADLFTEVKQEEKPEVVDATEPTKRQTRSGFHIDEETGVVYMGDIAIGRIVHLGQKTTH